MSAMTPEAVLNLLQEQRQLWQWARDLDDRAAGANAEYHVTREEETAKMDLFLEQYLRVLGETAVTNSVD